MSSTKRHSEYFKLLISTCYYEKIVISREKKHRLTLLYFNYNLRMATAKEIIEPPFCENWAYF